MTSYNDIFRGNDADNVFLAYGGDDVIQGGGGIDTADFSGTAGVGFPGLSIDLAAGTVRGAGVTTIAGPENIVGSAKSDLIIGDAEANKLSGGSGDDSLEGGDGDDWLGGGAGHDRLTGGNGADTFHFDNNPRTDVVTDFTDGADLIDFSVMNFGSFVEVMAVARQDAMAVEFQCPSGAVVKILDITLAQFDAADFIL